MIYQVLGEIKRQYRLLCSRANMLIRKFRRSSEQVRQVLFRAYALYCTVSLNGVALQKHKQLALL